MKKLALSLRMTGLAMFLAGASGVALAETAAPVYDVEAIEMSSGAPAQSAGAGEVPAPPQLQQPFTSDHVADTSLT